MFRYALSLPAAVAASRIEADRDARQRPIEKANHDIVPSSRKTQSEADDAKIFMGSAVTCPREISVASRGLSPRRAAEAVLDQEATLPENGPPFQE